MPKEFEHKVGTRGGATRWRNKSLPGGKYLKIAVTPKAGPRGGHTVAHVKTKQTEGQERILHWLGRGQQPIQERGAHAKGCSCGFCKNKGNISNYWKGKLKDAASGKKEEEEPKDMTEGLEARIAEAEGAIKLSKGTGNIGAANKTYGNMTSKQAMTPEWKPKAYMKADAEATGQLGRMKGFKIEGEGETTSGKPLPKTRPGESLQRAQLVAAKLLDD